MMLAESIINNVPLQIAAWLACLWVLLMIANAGFSFFRHVIGKPAYPPNEQIDDRVKRLEAMTDRLARELADEREKNEVHASQRSKHIYDKIEETRRDIEQRIEHLNAEANESRSRLHDRINPIVENTAEIKGRMEAFTQAFDNFTKMFLSIAESRNEK